MDNTTLLIIIILVVILLGGGALSGSWLKARRTTPGPLASPLSLATNR